MSMIIADHTSAVQSSFPTVAVENQGVPAAGNLNGKVWISHEENRRSIGTDKSVTDYSLPKLDAPTNLGEFDSGAAIFQFLALNTDVSSKQVEAATNFAQVNMESKKAVNQERLDKIQESIDHLRGSRKRKIFRDIFGWVTPILATVGALGFAVATAGAGTPLLAAAIGASGALGTLQTVSSNTGDWMNKIGGKSDRGQMIASWTWTAAIMALSMGSGLALGRSVSQQASNAANQASGVAQATAGRMQTIARQISLYSATGEGLSASAKGGLDIENSVKTYQSGLAQSEATIFRGLLTRISQQIDSDLDFINNWHTVIASGQQKVAAILQESQKTTENLVKNI